MEDFLNKEYVIFDVETTGLSPLKGDRLVEVAALKIKNLQPVNRFHSLINPERSISLAAFEVNRISDKMVMNAPRSFEILPSFLEFLGEATVVGHNIKFDLGFLHNELDLAGLPTKKKIQSVDTIRIARKVMPHLRRYPLWFVADSLGISERQKHRAMADVDLTFDVFCRLIKIAKEKNMIKEIFS